MNDHSFSPKSLNPKECTVCNRPEWHHGKLAACEACPNRGKCHFLGSLLLCQSCYQKELESAKQYVSSGQALQTNLNDSLKTSEKKIEQMSIESSKQIDQSIRYNGDVFNAQTVSIIELKAIIDASDEYLPDQKDFELAKVVKDRIIQFQENIFKKKIEIETMQGGVLAHQQYLNQLVSKLKSDEREQFKENNINYHPKEITKAIKLPTVRKGTDERIILNMMRMAKITREEAEIRWARDNSK